MIGISFLTNTKGKQTHIVLDLEVYGDNINQFLEDLSDIEAVKAVEGEESVSIEEVRKALLAKGEVSDNDLAKIPNV